MVADTDHFVTAVTIVREQFLCPWRCRVNLIAAGLVGFSSVWRTRSGPMDHRLRSEWAHLRGHRRSAIGYDPG